MIIFMAPCYDYAGMMIDDLLFPKFINFFRISTRKGAFFFKLIVCK